MASGFLLILTRLLIWFVRNTIPLNFPDDGPFQISADPGEVSRQDGDVYYKATSYNGYGSDITSLVSVENENQVDDETLNDDTTLTISVDDKSIRGLSQGCHLYFKFTGRYCRCLVSST